MKYYSIKCGSIEEARALEAFVRVKIANLEKERASEQSPIIGKVLPDNTLQLILFCKEDVMAEIWPKIEEISRPQTPTSIHPTLLMPIKEIKMSRKLRRGLEQIDGMECLGDMLAIRRLSFVNTGNLGLRSWQELVDIAHQFCLEPESMAFGWKIGGIHGELTPDVLYLPLWGLNISRNIYFHLYSKQHRSDGAPFDDIPRFGDLLTLVYIRGRYQKVIEQIVRGYGFETNTLPQYWRDFVKR